MRLYYDTEFIEDGRTIELISIGMVAEDGRELYLVNEAIGQDFAAGGLYRKVCDNDWLMRNVVPHLPLAPRRGGEKSIGRLAGRRWFFNLDFKSNVVVSIRFIRNAVREFIQATPDAELWAWYGAYDHVVLAQLFGRMIDLPEGVPMWTNDLKQEVVRLGNPRLPKQESAEHNALADARWVRDCYSLLSS